MADLPIACTLSPAERQEQRADLLPGLLAQAVERLPAANGYRWRFAAADGLLATMGRVIDAERRCCRFLHFVVRAEPDRGAVFLEVTGPAGTKEFLEQLVNETAA
jgi:hypothetical protein